MNAEKNYDANQDPDHLEREIDEQRREINETLRALEAKFTKEEIAGQVVNYFGGAGKEWIALLGSSMKHNPVPTLLTGVGIAWLMMSERSGSRPRYYYDERRYAGAYDGSYGGYDGSYAGEGYEGGEGGMFADATDSARNAAQGLKEKAGAVGEKAAHAREALGERASHARERMGERAMHAREAMRSRASNARYGMRHSADSVRTNFSHLAQEQPLALGAIGIALGALLGVALPRTERETRILGRASERVRERGMEMARDGYEKASRKASDVAEKTKDVLHRTLEEKHRQMSSSKGNGADTDTGYSATTNTLYSTASAQDPGATDDAVRDDTASGTINAQQQPNRAGTAPGA